MRILGGQKAVLGATIPDVSRPKISHKCEIKNDHVSLQRKGDMNQSLIYKFGKPDLKAYMYI
jgi:hypothetical protein